MPDHHAIGPGFDSHGGRPWVKARLASGPLGVYMIPVGGMFQRMKCAMGGSGSTYVYGYSDAQFKENMKVDECKQFITKTLSLAMTRDGGSGGVIRLGVITGKGDIEREIISGDAIPKCYEG
ncbi:hypothetical protein AAG570_005126 [Ranatra chinensis]|uniref:proteasome endopeptidase complex n=1 Tax=Ranatra chinensis TaxID=642074 RepID=A0ABD0YLC1_9HEMI